MASECRYFKVADITIEVASDMSLSDVTFSPNLVAFETEEPEVTMIRISHHFGLPDLTEKKIGQKVYERRDLTVYRNPDGWIFFSTILDIHLNPLQQVVFVDPSYTAIEVYNERDDIFKTGEIPVLSFYQTDQLFLTRTISDLRGCMLHAAGVDLDGEGLLFVGHSEAGKSTMIKLFDGKARILCDDRIIVRKDSNGFRIYGTWHHGEIPVVSPLSAPLKAILLLEKAPQNRLLPITDPNQLISRLSACTIKAIKPLTTADWWKKTLNLIDDLVREVPCRILEFDKSGQVVDLLREFKA